MAQIVPANPATMPTSAAVQTATVNPATVQAGATDLTGAMARIAPANPATVQTNAAAPAPANPATMRTGAAAPAGPPAESGPERLQAPPLTPGEAGGPLPAFSGDSILQSMLQRAAPPESAAVAAASANAGLADRIEELAERILVSARDSLDNKVPEVRITLKDSILPDTEVVLRRSEDGALRVLLITDNASSRQTLLESEGLLREKLSSFNSSVSVEILERGEERQGQEGDSQRRSRGLPADYETEDQT
jgi:hypothetical protein